jgi:hypothetical protein
MKQLERGKKIQKLPVIKIKKKIDRMVIEYVDWSCRALLVS